MALGAEYGCDGCVHLFLRRAYYFALNSSSGFEVIGHRPQIHDSEHSVNKRSKAGAETSASAASGPHHEKRTREIGFGLRGLRRFARLCAQHLAQDLHAAI